MCTWHPRRDNSLLQGLQKYWTMNRIVRCRRFPFSFIIHTVCVHEDRNPLLPPTSLISVILQQASFNRHLVSRTITIRDSSIFQIAAFLLKPGVLSSIAYTHCRVINNSYNTWLQPNCKEIFSLLEKVLWTHITNLEE